MLLLDKSPKRAHARANKKPPPKPRPTLPVETLTDVVERARLARAEIRSKFDDRYTPPKPAVPLETFADFIARTQRGFGPPPPKPAGGRLIDRLTSDERKTYPITSGVMDYFPDAIAAVSNVSWAGNEKHNPGQPLHWARGKSMDHADCCSRHLQSRGGYDTLTIDGKQVRVRHTAALAWRALALLQEELEADEGLPLPRGAKAPV